MDSLKFTSSTTCEEVREKLKNVPGVITEAISKGTVVVTGANTGIGKATAQHLSFLGTTVILACRNVDKAKEAISEIRNSKGYCKKYGIEPKELNLIPMKLDLGDFVTVKEFTESLVAKVKGNELPQIRAIVLNAGLFPARPALSKHNIDLCFQVNHLGHFYMMKELVNAGPTTVFPNGQCRVISVSSGRHFGPYSTDQVTDRKSMLHYVAGVPQEGMKKYEPSERILCNCTMFEL